MNGYYGYGYGPYVGQQLPSTGATPQNIIKYVSQITNDAFWKLTGYKPGQSLNPKSADDAAMIPLWLAMNYADVSRMLYSLRAVPPGGTASGDTASIQRLTEQKNKLARFFASNPELDRRAQEMGERFAAQRHSAP